MNGCIYQTKDGECELYAEGGKYTAFCDIDNCESKRPSNADRIREMGDAELAEFLSNVDGDFPPTGSTRPVAVNQCKEVWIDWLRREADDG